VPLLAGGLVAVRALRINGVYQTIGAVHFVAISAAVWVLGGRAIVAGAEARRRLAIAGVLLVAPFALVALLWVGIATPWEATVVENRLRYLVLLAGSITVAGGFIILKETLDEAGERLYSTLGFAAAILAGAAYINWTSFQLGAYVLMVHDGQAPPAVIAMSNVFDILLFIAGVLTYLATAAFAASLGRIGWLSRRATRVYVFLNLVALVCLAARGLSFPDPTESAMPWYVRPGFVAGIPAVPWIMPFLLGVVLLRRAGDERS
jgi:hypothetical protein